MCAPGGDDFPEEKDADELSAAPSGAEPSSPGGAGPRTRSGGALAGSGLQGWPVDATWRRRGGEQPVPRDRPLEGRGRRRSPGTGRPELVRSRAERPGRRVPDHTRRGVPHHGDRREARRRRHRADARCATTSWAAVRTHGAPSASAAGESRGARGPDGGWRVAGLDGPGRRAEPCAGPDLHRGHRGGSRRATPRSVRQLGLGPRRLARDARLRLHARLDGPSRRLRGGRRRRRPRRPLRRRSRPVSPTGSSATGATAPSRT